MLHCRLDVFIDSHELGDIYSIRMTVMGPMYVPGPITSTMRGWIADGEDYGDLVLLSAVLERANCPIFSGFPNVIVEVGIEPNSL